ncbi:hypothetical protein Vretifemale_9521, partial [Volvox reticuliferus]
GGRPVSACPQSFSCSRPAGWCTNTSSVFRSLDCDGDGVLDLTCSNSTGERWAILSQDGCAEDWTGGRPVSVCPQSFSCSRPAGWCTNTSSVFRSLDCDGDGVL